MYLNSNLHVDNSLTYFQSFPRSLLLLFNTIIIVISKDRKMRVGPLSVLQKVGLGYIINWFQFISLLFSALFAVLLYTLLFTIYVVCNLLNVLQKMQMVAWTLPVVKI